VRNINLNDGGAAAVAAADDDDDDDEKITQILTPASRRVAIQEGTPSCSLSSIAVAPNNTNYTLVSQKKNIYIYNNNTNSNTNSNSSTNIRNSSSISTTYPSFSR